MLALKDKSHVRLVSRNERDHTRRFPNLVELAKLKSASLILDGEVAVFDEELISRFEWLRHLNHADLMTPPLYMVFDLLHLGEKDYRPEPLKVRRKALEKLIKGQSLILPARRLLANGMAAWAEVLHRGIEGYVATDSESPNVGGAEREMAQAEGARLSREGTGVLRSLAALRHLSSVSLYGRHHRNGAQPNTMEAELWWDRPDEKEAGKWRCFRRCVAPIGSEAVRRVEADFKEWGRRAKRSVGALARHRTPAAQTTACR